MRQSFLTFTTQPSILVAKRALLELDMRRVERQYIVKLSASVIKNNKVHKQMKGMPAFHLRLQWGNVQTADADTLF